MLHVRLSEYMDGGYGWIYVCLMCVDGWQLDLLIYGSGENSSDLLVLITSVSFNLWRSHNLSMKSFVYSK
jgi:hypothetical protein